MGLAAHPDCALCSAPDPGLDARQLKQAGAAARLAIRAELKLQELVPELALVADIVAHVEVLIGHAAAAAGARGASLDARARGQQQDRGVSSICQCYSPLLAPPSYYSLRPPARCTRPGVFRTLTLACDEPRRDPMFFAA